MAHQLAIAGRELRVTAHAFKESLRKSVKRIKSISDDRMRFWFREQEEESRS